jgi:prostaglandin reductase 3
VAELQDAAKIQACKAKAFAMYRSGELMAVVDERRFSGLESVVGAVDYMLSGKALGKVVVSL